MKKKSVCYILSYYSPDYIRTRTLIKALELLDDFELFQARNSSKGFFRYFQTLFKLVAVRIFHNPELYILGFRGYELFWVVRLITLGKPLIFDHMMSPFDSLINEKRTIKKSSVLAKLIFYYEKSILFACNLILTDTDLHKRYFQELFSLKHQKIEAIPISADEELFYPTQNLPPVSKESPFEVLYYGSFLPLHGIDIILKTALDLLDFPIHFTLIGGNRMNLSEFHKEIKKHNLHNIHHIPWVDFFALPGYIKNSDIGLGGGFGNTGQARRVITGKTFQFLAMSKPVVVGELDEDCGFIDKVNCLIVPQGDSVALTDAILWAFQNKSNLDEIGQRGFELYQSRYSVKQVSEILRGLINHEISSS